MCNAAGSRGGGVFNWGTSTSALKKKLPLYYALSDFERRGVMHICSGSSDGGNGPWYITLSSAVHKRFEEFIASETGAGTCRRCGAAPRMDCGERR